MATRAAARERRARNPTPQEVTMDRKSEARWNGDLDVVLLPPNAQTNG